MTDNLLSKTGRSLEDWFVVLDETGLEKHTELMNHIKQEYGVSHGFANTIVLHYRAQGTSQADDDLVNAQYQGAKAALRPIYDALIATISGFGDDVEIAPKKTGVSLRRSKQFALIEAPSAKRLQIGIQLKGVEPTDRLLIWGAMCSHKVFVTSLDDVDPELFAWLRDAYEMIG